MILFVSFICSFQLLAVVRLAFGQMLDNEIFCCSTFSLLIGSHPYHPTGSKFPHTCLHTHLNKVLLVFVLGVIDPGCREVHLIKEKGEADHFD